MKELGALFAEKAEELRAMRFSMSEKNTKKGLALRKQISRIQTALRSLTTTK